MMSELVVLSTLPAPLRVAAKGVPTVPPETSRLGVVTVKPELMLSVGEAEANLMPLTATLAPCVTVPVVPLVALIWLMLLAVRAAAAATVLVPASTP